MNKFEHLLLCILALAAPVGLDPSQAATLYDSIATNQQNLAAIVDACPDGPATMALGACQYTAGQASEPDWMVHGGL